MSNTLKDEISKIWQEAHDTLGSIINATKKSDERAVSNGALWFNRHRLQFLLDITNQSRKTIQKDGIVEPWYLAELKLIINILKEWKKKPIWKDIEPSLKDKNHFKHTIGKLFFVKAFEKQGTNIELIPRGNDGSPDLRIQSSGKIKDWLLVECYQPDSFSGVLLDIHDRQLKKIINRSMDKAKKQLSLSQPGCMAIIGFNQPNEVWERLKQFTIDRLDDTDRPSLAGFLFLKIGCVVLQRGISLSFSMRLKIEYISNPSYFGDIEIKETPRGDRLFLDDYLVPVETFDLIGKTISEVKIPIGKKEVEKTLPRKDKNVLLEKIENANPTDSTIITSSLEGLPLFQGNSNFNYLCHNCESILAQGIWKYSLHNFIVRCPKCKSDNYIPYTEVPVLVSRSIAVQAGVMHFSNSVMLKRGIIMFGGISKEELDARVRKKLL